MINKKPFRVTNEQAKKDLIRECEDPCHVCEFDKPCREVESYAADLLDSRELIDKQEALIKEMREIVLTLWHDGCAEDYRKCCTILEKTKEYT